MIRSNQTSRKTPLCWNKEPQSPALRVEQGEGAFFIFPYSHLIFAQLGNAKEKQSLSIFYPSHEVKIIGQHLDELAIALQYFSVEWIKSLPQRYAAVSKKEVVLIESIQIVESPD